MKLTFINPYWGSENMEPKAFVDYCLAHDFDGMELNYPKDSAINRAFKEAIKDLRSQKPGFIVVVQQILSNQKETAQEYQKRMLIRLESIRALEPDFINSHTGKDHFTFHENVVIIEAAEVFSQGHKLPLLHEIHRGRFSFHSNTLLPYLAQFPQLKLVGDLSHWCVVSESMLEDQDEILNKVLPNIEHIHARVGFEQACQVNNPFAPEWQKYLQRFLHWWRLILQYHKQHTHKMSFSITPEFGPFPYMPQTPFNQKPLSNQKAINLQFKEFLTQHLLS